MGERLIEEVRLRILVWFVIGCSFIHSPPPFLTNHQVIILRFLELLRVGFVTSHSFVFEQSYLAILVSELVGANSPLSGLIAVSVGKSRL